MFSLLFALACAKPVAIAAPVEVSPSIDPAVAAAQPSGVGDRTKAQIDAGVTANMDAIGRCFRVGVNRGGTKVGRVEVLFRIAADGTVTSAETGTSTLQNPAVESCINERFLEFEFPASANSVTVKYPFLFNGGA